MKKDEIVEFLKQLTLYLEQSSRQKKVLAAPSIKFLCDKLGNLNYYNLQEKFIILEGKDSLSKEFLTDRSWPGTDWLSENIDQAEIDRELFLMEWCLVPAVWQLLAVKAEIGTNPSSLKADDVLFSTQQIRKKVPKHYKDVFPFLEKPQSLENSDLSTETVDGCQLVVMIRNKLKLFINDPEFLKVIGTTIKSLQLGDEIVNWYLPVLHCYHPATRFNIMITLPSLEFLTYFALDDDQYQMLLKYQFVPERLTDNRKITELLSTINEEDIEGYLPKSFLENPTIDGDDFLSTWVRNRRLK